MRIERVSEPVAAAGLVVVAAVVVVAITLAVASAALAAAPGPGWAVRSVASPTVFSTEPVESEECKHLLKNCEAYFVTATNVGTVASSGTIVVRDVLPMGVTARKVPEQDARAYEPGNENGQGEEVSCAVGASMVTCSYGGSLAPGGIISFAVDVSVTKEAGGSVLNHAEVEELGGVGGVVSSGVTGGTTPTPVDAAPAVFGVEGFSVGVFGPAGERDVQAGGRPGTVATAITYNTRLDSLGENNAPYDPSQEPKIESVDLPTGFAGNALATPKCTAAQLADEACPVDTRVGVVDLFRSAGTNDELVYLYNIVPHQGYPAQFGLDLYESVVMLRARVLPSEGGYVLSVPVVVPQADSTKFREVGVTFFGDPSLQDGGGAGEAFATNPDGCVLGTLNARLEMDSWLDPGVWRSAEAAMYEAGVGQGVTGCARLQFDPSLEVAPETTQADTPSGYEAGVGLPQGADFEGDLATPDLKDALVSLPEGVSASPSVANGLVACQASGPEGIELGGGDRFASENTVEEGEELGPDGLVHPAAGHCPLASQIGEVEAVTPLLEEPLKGHVYIAAPECGGEGQGACTPASAEDGSLFGIYVEVAGSGVIIKMKGHVSVNPATGRLTTRFVDIPEQPVSEIRLKLRGGPRAPLANPQSCGPATTTSDLTPGSTPYTPDGEPVSSFTVTGCSGVFAPGFSAGMASTLQAGAFSSFTLALSRHDGEGDLSGLSVAMPEGLLARIAGIPECGEAAANAGTCGSVTPGSRVGSVVAAAGAGPDPFWQSGSVYFTGPYRGGPFGLSVVIPANAGPYHLGNIVVRASIRVNPVTAAATVVSDPFPQMIDGVPLRVQTVDVTVGGEAPFTFNSTDCTASNVTGVVSSLQGASVGVSSRYAPKGCAGLPFKPVFSASTGGAATKAHGASFTAKLVFPPAPAGSAAPGVDANVASFKLEFPKQLPARNTTLQKACLAAVFEANPAACPQASEVGSVLVHTPVLAGPLVGPMYLVSYGGEKFPQLVMILQGEGVTVDVTGSIFVSKAGITSVTLKTVPDAPFTSVEVKSPKGPYSVLTSYVPAKDEFNLCGQSLAMPTEIVGQNGAVFKQKTKIAITGCTKPKKANKKKGKKASRASASSKGGQS
jgi:hypothetical protein